MGPGDAMKKIATSASFARGSHSRRVIGPRRVSSSGACALNGSGGPLVRAALAGRAAAPPTDLWLECSRDRVVR